MCMENHSVLPRGIKPAGSTGELQATKRWASNKAGSVLPRGIKLSWGHSVGNSSTGNRLGNWRHSAGCLALLISSNRELEMAELDGEQGAVVLEHWGIVGGVSESEWGNGGCPYWPNDNGLGAGGTGAVS